MARLFLSMLELAEGDRGQASMEFAAALRGLPDAEMFWSVAAAKRLLEEEALRGLLASGAFDLEERRELFDRYLAAAEWASAAAVLEFSAASQMGAERARFVGAVADAVMAARGKPVYEVERALKFVRALDEDIDEYQRLRLWLLEYTPEEELARLLAEARAGRPADDAQIAILAASRFGRAVQRGDLKLAAEMLDLLGPLEEEETPYSIFSFAAR